MAAPKKQRTPSPAVRRFKMLGGTFTDEKGVTHRFERGKDTIVESDKPLDAMFVNCFEPLDDAPAFVPGAAPPIQLDDAGEVVGRADEPAPEDEIPVPEAGEDLGDDVTEDFDGAEEADLKVFKKGRQYHVAGADRPGEALNDEEFTTKGQVKDFLKKYGD